MTPSGVLRPRTGPTRAYRPREMACEARLGKVGVVGGGSSSGVGRCVRRTSQARSRHTSYCLLGELAKVRPLRLARAVVVDEKLFVDVRVLPPE